MTLVLREPAKDDRREEQLRRLLLSHRLLAFDAVIDSDGAARIYRRCRAAGVTPGGMVDCMIAAVAWRAGAALLACDGDLARVAGVVGIAMDDASLRA
ncbi:MAG TPA: PIN domain-containing protein [Solirubrobacteraceae bacterium]